MTRIITGLITGLIIGGAVPMIEMNAKIISAILIVALDGLIGGFKASLLKKFDDRILITSFVINSTIAIMITYLGDYVGVKLHYAVIFVFVFKIFKNLSQIRRYITKKI